jgi:molybdate transport system substrate-binding protein
VTPSVAGDVSTITIPDAYNQIAEYPIGVTKDARNKLAADAFIAYVLSAEGQGILKGQNFIPVQ